MGVYCELSLVGSGMKVLRNSSLHFNNPSTEFMGGHLRICYEPLYFFLEDLWLSEKSDKSSQ